MINKGDCINSLKLIEVVGTVKHGRNNIKVWSCQCNCGNILDVDQNSITKGLVPACKTCRRGPCAICNGKITDDTFSVKRNTCSEICRREQIRKKHLKYYSKLINNDFNHNKIRYKNRLEKNPNMNKIKYLSFKKRISKIGESERLSILNKMYKQSSQWRKQWLLTASHQDVELYRARQRRSYRKHIAQKELAKLMKTKLGDTSNEK